MFCCCRVLACFLSVTCDSSLHIVDNALMHIVPCRQFLPTYSLLCVLFCQDWQTAENWARVAGRTDLKEDHHEWRSLYWVRHTTAWWTRGQKEDGARTAGECFKASFAYYQNSDIHTLCVSGPFSGYASVSCLPFWSSSPSVWNLCICDITPPHFLTYSVHSSIYVCHPGVITIHVIC